jgi:hypothetical protein
MQQPTGKAVRRIDTEHGNPSCPLNDKYAERSGQPAVGGHQPEAATHETQRHAHASTSQVGVEIDLHPAAASRTGGRSAPLK